MDESGIDSQPLIGRNRKPFLMPRTDKRPVGKHAQVRLF